MDFLHGVVVVDATRLLPGGYCTMLLSDMGAEVIKVEQPGFGDYMRATPPTRGGKSPLHSMVNRNKLSIGVDLKSEKGKEVMRRLLRRADVFVEGFRPGAMSRLGFSFREVKKIRPRIVYCSISAYGQKARLSSMPGHDINFQAMAGTMSYAAAAEVPLLQLGDLASGMYAALGILGALARRRGAVHLDVPIVGSLLSWMVVPASAYLATGVAPKAGHSLVFGSAPYYNVYRTSDGKYMAVAAIEDVFWRNLMSALGLKALTGKRFGTSEEREKVTSEMRRVFSTKTRDEWAGLLMDRDTCATPVLGMDEALKSDWARKTSALVPLGKGKVLNEPLRSSPPMRKSAFTEAPGLGSDTLAIMARLGYSRRVTAALRRSGVIQ